MKTSVNLLKKTVGSNGNYTYVFHKCKTVEIAPDLLLAMYKDNSLVRPHFEELMKEHNVSDAEVLIPADLYGGSLSAFARTYVVNHPKGRSKEDMDKIRQARKCFKKNG